MTYATHHSLREDGVPLSLRGVIPRHEKGHIPAITKPTEIVPLVQAINTYKSPITRAALKLTMLTGLRPGVIAAAPWDEIDMKAGEWHVLAARMKMRHDHIVPLSICLYQQERDGAIFLAWSTRMTSCSTRILTNIPSSFAN
ncbi:tyrosine-type recombinase/integrase [Paraburkholderia sp.]|uniref:tyrosine-type recombinase/integrase n=1 Tax=Paraburkholderia sp. TaxID=1926495 RepID=UPI0025CC5297|nr:tyrosine-type recombinase/integrase [Paraburkholderia sp.]